MRRSRGISLVEVLIALVILAIALVGMAVVPIVTTKQIAGQIQRSRALFVAASALDEMEARYRRTSGNAAVSADQMYYYLDAEKTFRAFLSHDVDIVSPTSGGAKSIANSLTVVVELDVRWDGPTSLNRQFVFRTISRLNSGIPNP